MQEIKTNKINIDDVLTTPYPPVPVTKKEIEKWEIEQQFKEKAKKIGNNLKNKKIKEQ